MTPVQYKPLVRSTPGHTKIGVPLELGEDAKKKRRLQIWVMAGLAVLGSLALLNGLVGNPCYWARSYQQCVELPYGEQVIRNIGAPLVFLGLSALGFGEIAYGMFLRAPPGLELEATPTRVRARVGGETQYEGPPGDVRFRVEGATLVLERAVDGKQWRWDTLCEEEDLEAAIASSQA